MSRFVAFLVDGSSAVVDLTADEIPDGDGAGVIFHCHFVPAIDGSLVNVAQVAMFQPVVPGAEQPAERFKKGWFRR